MDYSGDLMNPADANTRARQYVLNSLIFISTFWALNQVAHLFQI